MMRELRNKSIVCDQCSNLNSLATRSGLDQGAIVDRGDHPIGACCWRRNDYKKQHVCMPFISDVPTR
jgi:hypothetical protein